MKMKRTFWLLHLATPGCNLKLKMRWLQFFCEELSEEWDLQINPRSTTAT